MNRHAASGLVPGTSWMMLYLTYRRRLRTYLFLNALVWAWSPLVGAQAEASPRTRERQPGVQEQLRTAQASRVDRAPKLDGKLDDPLWQRATPISNFFQ